MIFDAITRMHPQPGRKARSPLWRARINRVSLFLFASIAFLILCSCGNTQIAEPSSEPTIPALPTPTDDKDVLGDTLVPASQTPYDTPEDEGTADGIPTDEQVQDAYWEAVQAFAWFEMESLNAASSSTFEQNGQTYYRVTERLRPTATSQLT